MPDVLLGLAQQLGGEVGKALPWTTYDAMLRAAIVPLRTHGAKTGNAAIDSAKTDDDFWQGVQAQGGWWSEREGGGKIIGRDAWRQQTPVAAAAAQFAGDAPIFLSISCLMSRRRFGDGSYAHLPWLQELPDLLTTAMWAAGSRSIRRTGERLGIQKAMWSRSRRCMAVCASGDSFAGHRARHDGDAGRTGTPEVYALCERPRREPGRDSRAGYRNARRARWPGRRRG